MRLYNSLTREKEDLPPPPGPVRMYVCGSTVYQRVHVGNSRPFVIAMWIRSWLRHQGFDVTLVHNITDVDDKVYEEAAKLGVPSRELAARATDWFFQDTDDLGLGRPDLEPRASETMPEIVVFIEELLARDVAYRANGDVYFRVAQYPDYGRLSGAQLDEMIAQEPSDKKEDQRDFALWKGQKEHEDAAWPSPWGPGRPGWHIECSAMAEKYLGAEFELHGGGNDLRFPHHENELAQSRALGHPFARVWIHNGMLQLDEAKMSKSLGNVVTLRNVLDTWGREALLVFHLTGFWSKPVDFNDDVMQQAAARADRFREVFRNPSQPAPEDAWVRFTAALEDDFNTPDALAVMHEWRDHELLRRALGVFGLATLAEDSHEESENGEDGPRVIYMGNPPSDEVKRLARERYSARMRGDYAAADALRLQIEDLGDEVRDTPEGYVVARRGRR